MNEQYRFWKHSKQQINRTIQGLIVVSLLALSVGCSSRLEIAPASGPEEGLVYTLPFTQFKTTITRRVASCKNGLKISTSAKFEPLQSTDPNHIYVINPTSISGGLIKGSAEIDLYEDTLLLKSVNSDVTDESAELATSVIKTVASIATSAASGIPTTKDLAPHMIQHCNSETKKTLSDIAKKKSEVKQETLTQTNLNAEIVSLRASIALLLPSKDPKLESLLSAKLQAASAQAEVVKLKAGELAKLEKMIVENQIMTWPSDSTSLVSETNSISDAKYDQWRATKVNVGGEMKTITKNKDGHDIHFRLSGADSYNAATLLSACKAKLDSGKECDRSHSNGIRYRTPAKGKLELVFSNKSSKVVGHYPVSQLGYVNMIDIASGKFEQVKYKVEFSKAGYLTKYRFETAVSAVGGITDIVEAVGEGYLARKQAKAEADQKILEAHEKKLKTINSINDETAKIRAIEAGDETFDVQEIIDAALKAAG